jgi:spore coat protein U-like protein
MLASNSHRGARQGAFLSAALAGLAMSVPAQAGQSTGTIDLELNVTNACLVNGATTVQSDVGSTGKVLFADQPGTFVSVDGQLVGSMGNLTVQCTPGSAPVLTVGSGAHDSNGARHLASGASQVTYRLFTDSARTDEIIIGKQIALTSAAGASASVPIFARATNGGTLLSAGKYTDTVQVLLSW